MSEVGSYGRCVALGAGKGKVGEMLRELQRQRFRGFFGIEFDQRPTEDEVVQSAAFYQQAAKELTSA